MNSSTSGGLLMYRLRDGSLEVLLAHPGGPFFAQKDRGHWTVPKGEPQPGEDLLATAIREFKEEIGFEPKTAFVELGSIRQKGGKVVHAWAFAVGPETVVSPASNLVEMEWPPRSGRRITFPEIDRAEFFPLAEARQKIREAQRPFLDRLEAVLGHSPPHAHPLAPGNQPLRPKES